MCNLCSLAFLFVVKLVLWIGTRGGRNSYESCKLENALPFHLCIYGFFFFVTFGVPFIFVRFLSLFNKKNKMLWWGETGECSLLTWGCGNLEFKVIYHLVHSYYFHLVIIPERYSRNHSFDLSILCPVLGNSFGIHFLGS